MVFTTFVNVLDVMLWDNVEVHVYFYKMEVCFDTRLYFVICFSVLCYKCNRLVKRWLIVIIDIKSYIL